MTKNIGTLNRCMGGGLVVIEVFYLIMMSWGIHNFDEIEELTKGIISEYT